MRVKEKDSDCKRIAKITYWFFVQYNIKSRTMADKNIFQKVKRFIDIPAFIPSAIVALIHFKLSVLVGTQSNNIFQRWFDTGESATGSDAIVSSVDAFLSKPIPTVFLANHPSQSLPFEWWLATAVNSFCWGLFIYICCKLSFKFLT